MGKVGGRMDAIARGTLAQSLLARAVAADLSRYAGAGRTERMEALHRHWTGMMAAAGINAGFARDFADDTIAMAADQIGEDELPAGSENPAE